MDTYIKPDTAYTRESTNIKALGTAQLRQYLHLKGLSQPQIDTFLQTHLPTAEPEYTRFIRVGGEDKHVETIPLSTQFSNIQEERLVAAPTLTTYLNKDVTLSAHSRLINKRLAWRKQVKQLAFDAETRGDKVEEEFQNLLQTAIKKGSNSVSGIYGILSTAIGNRSSHSTLTSTARGATNTANIALERLLSGDLALLHPDSALHYVLALVEEYAKEASSIDVALSQLAVPSVKHVYNKLVAISLRYHYSHEAHQRLRTTLSSLTPQQLAFVCYAGSLYNITELNNDFIRSFVDTMLAVASTPINPALTIDSAKTYIGQVDDSVANAAHHLLFEELRGKGNNYNEIEPELVIRIATVCERIYQVLQTYASVLKPLIMCYTLAPNMAYTKQITRSVIAGSDTDSNIIALMRLVEWYSGHAYPTLDNIKVLAVFSIIVGFIIDDTLRQFSVNLGLEGKEINRISMKSELTASSIGMVRLTKTYFENAIIKEKSVLTKPKLIIKGVHLKSSNLPTEIVVGAHTLMQEISTSLMNKEPIQLNSIIQRVMEIERDIVKSVHKGDRKYLRLLRINPADSYKDTSPLKNNAGWADFWPQTIDLPTLFVKLPTTLENQTSLKNWLASLPPDVQPRIVQWVTDRGRKELPTIYIPEDFMVAYGTPDYIRPIVDVNRIVNDICNIYYIVLHSLGYAKSKDLSVCEDFGYSLDDVH